MNFYTLLYFVLQTAICHGRTEKMAAFTTMAPKMDRNIYKKTAELIHLIYGIYNKNEYEKEQFIPGIKTDYFSMHHNKEMALKQILKLVQKNYDASKQYKDLPKIRLHYVSNPEVLEQFKAIMKQKDKSISYEEYSESDPNRKLKEILKSLRRQAVFRIDDPASAEKAVPETQQIVDTIQQNPEDTLKSSKQEFFVDLVGNSRKKEKESKEKDNAWDIITKKYDWDDKDNDWGGKDINISEDNNKKSNKKADKKDRKDNYHNNGDKNIDIWDNWGQNKDRKEEKWDVRQDTKKNDWDDWGKNKNKKDDKWDDLGQDKKKDGWDNWDKNKDKKDDKRVDMGQDKRIDFWDAPVKKKDKKRKIDKLEEWGQNDKKDSWDDGGQKKKKQKKDTWGNEAKPKPNKEINDIKWNESNKRKGYDSKKKEKDRDNQNSWNNWEMTTKQKRKTTKRNSQITYKKINEWDHYVPKVQSKPKRYEYDRHIPAGVFGRTSIPFVGKKGIYEDK